MKRIKIAEPQIGEDERRALFDVLEGEVFVKGPRVTAFERAFAGFHGARHGVAVNSGTTALVAALIGHGVGPGDEVIVPSFSFFASAACVRLAGATPVFADIDPDRYCLSPEAVERAVTRRTRAVLVVHLFGLPADLPRLSALCEAHGLVLIEDAAQAHGAKLGERRVGSFGTAGFSFHATKNMTTFEGGMLLTNDAEVAQRARAFSDHGRSPGGAHDVLGGNFRMTEQAAALGSVQLARLEDFNAARIANARALSAGLSGVSAPREYPETTHVYHQYTVSAPSEAARDRLITGLNERGIEARVYYGTPIHRQAYFASDPAHRNVILPATEHACRHVLSLPVHPGVGPAELDRIVSTVEALLRAGT